MDKFVRTNDHAPPRSVVPSGGVTRHYRYLTGLVRLKDGNLRLVRIIKADDTRALVVRPAFGRFWVKWDRISDVA